MIRVFVYGTLMRGGCYHSEFLKGHKFLGRAIISNYALYDLGSYPGVAEEAGERVKGEVYGIDWKTLRNIDLLEDNGSLYNRKRVRVQMEDGMATRAYVYIWNGAVDAKHKVPFEGQPWRP